MNKIPQDPSRRSFLGAGASLIAAAGIAASDAVAQEQPDREVTQAGYGVTVLTDALNRIGRERKTACDEA